MGASTTGLQPVGTYTVGDSGGNLTELLRIIPDPDAAHGSGAVAGGAHLDEMSPGAAAQLRAEILAMGGGSSSTERDFASGSHTITSGEALANLVDITTGLDDFTLSKSSVSVWNGTTLATSDAVISKQTGGVLRVADGSTYNTVAGYVIRWSVTR